MPLLGAEIHGEAAFFDQLPRRVEPADLEGPLAELLQLARTVPIASPRIGSAATTAKFIRP